jgi:hypothetical protein
MSNIPSFETFRNEIKAIYPEGDLRRSYERIIWYIDNERICSDGVTPITYRLIMDKFAAHINQWNIKYGARDPKYVSKEIEEKKKDLYNFIGLKMYEREFQVTNTIQERDKYLFGSFTRSYLKTKLDEFKKTYKKTNC